MKENRIAPEDSSEWKCNWLNCAGGQGLAGNGCCSFMGEWWNRDCKEFITEEDFEKKYSRKVKK